MTRPSGPGSYVVLWTQDRCRTIRRSGDLGHPLEVVYGGVHTSQPLLSRYGIGAGDTLYPVSVLKGALLVVGGMTVTEVVPSDDYVTEHLGVDPTEYVTWRAAHPELGHRLPWGCCVEAAVGIDGAPLSLERELPGEVLSSLFFVAKTGKERQLRPVRDGRLANTLGLRATPYGSEPTRQTRSAR